MIRFLIPLILFCLSALPVAAEEKWKGIDESVIEKYAQDRGADATDPFLPMEGDLLLFLFALAGGIGGFIMGYYWHKVIVAGKREEDGKDG
ncbi:MAG: hypothetical protein R6V08_10830 [Desulfuromonadales bacterium]